MSKSDLIDTRKQDKDREKAEKRTKRDDADVKKILSMPEGRRYFWKLLSRTRLYKTNFTGNSETFMLEGKRQVGLLVLGDILSADKTAFAQMQQEYYSEVTSEELIRQKEEKEN